jgi:hypothetical protein
MYAENLRKMISKVPNKNELRTKATRELLLRAAETIFVRDGYEGQNWGRLRRLRDVQREPSMVISRTKRISLSRYLQSG